MEKRHSVHEFPPIKDEFSKVLILGSVPSIKSVEYGFYYMHPQNRFWKLLSVVYGENVTAMSRAEKTDFLLRRRIALFDSVMECDIMGSSDLKITSVIPADISSLMNGSSIERILCNGTASYMNLIKYHPQYSDITVKLPSTSPANAAFSLERLIEVWKPYLP